MSLLMHSFDQLEFEDRSAMTRGMTSTKWSRERAKHKSLPKNKHPARGPSQSQLAAFDLHRLTHLLLERGFQIETALPTCPPSVFRTAMIDLRRTCTTEFFHVSKRT